MRTDEVTSATVPTDLTRDAGNALTCNSLQERRMPALSSPSATALTCAMVKSARAIRPSQRPPGCRPLCSGRGSSREGLRAFPELCWLKALLLHARQKFAALFDGIYRVVQ
jgi:hypothetical protein